MCVSVFECDFFLRECEGEVPESEYSGWIAAVFL